MFNDSAPIWEHEKT